MKAVVLSPAAEAALSDILEYSVGRWGAARAEAYKDQLLDRIRRLAGGELPHPKPCDVLMQGRRGAKGLRYFREGRHFIIIRETAIRIEVVDFIHESRDLERQIEKLIRKRER